MSDQLLAKLRRKSFFKPLPDDPELMAESRRLYEAQLRRLGADGLVARLTGPRRPRRVPWWRPWARLRR